MIQRCNGQRMLYRARDTNDSETYLNKSTIIHGACGFLELPELADECFYDRLSSILLFTFLFSDSLVPAPFDRFLAIVVPESGKGHVYEGNEGAHG